MTRRIKAHDIPDVVFLVITCEESQRLHGRVDRMISRDYVHRRMPSVPPKVVIAKFRKLQRRGLMDGCDCGCSGGWEVTEKGLELIEPYRIKESVN